MKYVYCAAFVVGFSHLLGTCGGLERNLMTITEFLTLAPIGPGIMAISLYLLKQEK